MFYIMNKRRKSYNLRRFVFYFNIIFSINSIILSIGKYIIIKLNSSNAVAISIAKISTSFLLDITIHIANAVTQIIPINFNIKISMLSPLFLLNCIP